MSGVEIGQTRPNGEQHAATTARVLSPRPKLGVLEKRHVQAVALQERQNTTSWRKEVEMMACWMFILLAVSPRPGRCRGVRNGRRRCWSGKTIDPS